MGIYDMRPTPHTNVSDPEILDRITEWMNNVIIRADNDVDAYLDQMLDEIRSEQAQNESIDGQEENNNG